MERQIKESIMCSAQAKGHPDLVAGQEGKILNYNDEVKIKIK